MRYWTALFGTLALGLHTACGGTPLEPTALLGTWDVVHLNGEPIPGTVRLNLSGATYYFTWDAYYFEFEEAGLCALYSQFEWEPTPQRGPGTCAYAVERGRAVTVTVLTVDGATYMVLDGAVNDRGTDMTLRDTANDNNWELRKRGS